VKEIKNGIFAINSGSSSIKFAVFEQARRLAKILDGRIEGIGTPKASFSMNGGESAGSVKCKISIEDAAAAVEILLDRLPERFQLSGIAGVGHRLVHGGPAAHGPQRISPSLLQNLHELRALDPEHLPAELSLIAAIERRLPAIPQVACFDTAFHHDLPQVAQLLAIPRSYQAKGVRRYGFHGLSYEYLMGELARIGGGAARGRVILAHLGSGASLAAVRDGKPVDTSMGFTPAAGLPMGSRSGDLDPGLVRFLLQDEGFDAERFNRFVNFECGLLGLSETSGDMRELLLRERTDSRAADAVALFCYQAKKWVGAFAAALGGVDTLVFAGGIGENCPAVRARICSGLEFLGIGLDEEENYAGAALISADGKPVAVRVIHTDEESVIVRSTCRVLGLEAVQEFQP
jgi:acetate kinase